ncbi:MAG: 30S ribosomal protein S13 [Candidatus Buchananbacteria bacterium CG10_big_fil_rev_8_21_14_0_10_42_9]|uniref:Small ribosomal subunit protein uS13 n=1 Tax=Candidatus Buchananbacteria bacterium CG10_big_fil_rev_8_21_14_0_10_42_9 TaxID=1974526 RepID=A0A2H0W124_9BACT|nr:MAG: 30S ribosomal protein S13 [Candidatus Buchananbacteria bacterium CG10_big_fil_rev_8_21_14_0_10_42_9]
MAVRIAGITLPNKRIQVALTYIYGIGQTTSAKILKQINVDPNKRANDLNESEIKKVRDVVEKEYKVEGDLKREVLTNIKRLKEINTYRGSRHAKHLPARGQRTKTNNRTVRGNVRKTMGSGRAPSAQKT